MSSHVNVANHAAFVDDENGGPGDALSRVKHSVALDDPHLRIRDQEIPHTQLSGRLVDVKRIVRAEGDDFGLQPMNFFGKLLELDELPLANTSEVTSIENHHEILLALEVGQLKTLDFERMRLIPRLGAILVERRGRRHPCAHEDESERHRRRTQSLASTDTCSISSVKTSKIIESGNHSQAES